MFSLFEEEQAKLKAAKRKQDLIEKKNRKKGLTFVVGAIEPVTLLSKGKYRKQYNGSYVRYIDATRRFHAYILDKDTIEIHTDKVVMGQEVGVWHVASDDMVREEIKRLKELMPGRVKVREKKGKVKYKVITLRQELLNELKNKPK